MGLNRAASATRRQNVFNAALAPAAPLAVKPAASTTAFIAPADVPDMPSMRSHGSSMSRSSTPQVNAPCEPPPCSARSTSTGSRASATGRPCDSFNDIAGSASVRARRDRERRDTKPIERRFPQRNALQAINSAPDVSYGSRFRLRPRSVRTASNAPANV